jgi:hypothetical protein
LRAALEGAKMSHEEVVRKILSAFTSSGTLKSRESIILLNSKEAFNKANTPKIRKKRWLLFPKQSWWVILSLAI